MALFSNLGTYKNFGLLIIRVGLGVMFIYHGLPKLMGGPREWAELGSATKYIGIHTWPMFFGFMSVVTETFGGFLVILGLLFRPVCLLLLINLVVAAAMQLGKGAGLDGAAHAIEDAVMFAGLFFVGPGRTSIDKK